MYKMISTITKQELYILTINCLNWSNNSICRSKRHTTNTLHVSAAKHLTSAAVLHTFG